MKDAGPRETRCRGRLPRPTGRRGRAATGVGGARTTVVPSRVTRRREGALVLGACTEAEASGRLACALQPHHRSGRSTQAVRQGQDRADLPVLPSVRQGLPSATSWPMPYALAKANGGAPGVDGETFEQIESAGRADWLARLREDLRTRRRINPPRFGGIVYIPKVGGVGERPLGIPTIRAASYRRRRC